MLDAFFSLIAEVASGFLCYTDWWWRPWMWVIVGLGLIAVGVVAWPVKPVAIVAWVLGGLACFYGIFAEVSGVERE